MKKWIIVLAAVCIVVGLAGYLMVPTVGTVQVTVPEETESARVTWIQMPQREGRDAAVYVKDTQALEELAGLIASLEFRMTADHWLEEAPDDLAAEISLGGGNLGIFYCLDPDTGKASVYVKSPAYTTRRLWRTYIPASHDVKTLTDWLESLAW